MRATSYIESLASDIDNTNPYIMSNNSLSYDGTNDNNLRYVSNNPNNYVLFNNELWRIVGVLNNIDDGNGNRESKLKIVRANSLGSKPWADSRGITYANSVLKDFLNVDYYNSINDESKQLISESIWNLGSLNTWGDNNTYDYYTKERGEEGIEPYTWKGYIAPLYGSDYGFAIFGSSSDERNECLNKYAISGNGGAEYDWTKADYCKLNDWLYKIDGTFKSYWFINHDSYNHGPSIAELTESGTAHAFGPPLGLGWTMDTYPSLYLRNDVKIVDGDGSKDNPYTLALMGYYNIKIDTENGNILTNLEELNDIIEETTVKLDVKPNYGYKLKKLLIKDSNNNNIELNDNIFIMPDSDITISADFELIEPIPETSDNINNFIIIFSISLLSIIISMKIIREI